MTVLKSASRCGNLPVVERLLERGADPNAADKIGVAALMTAAWGGHLPVVDRLLERGAYPSAADTDGQIVCVCGVDLRPGV